MHCTVHVISAQTSQDLPKFFFIFIFFCNRRSSLLNFSGLQLYCGSYANHIFLCYACFWALHRYNQHNPSPGIEHGQTMAHYCTNLWWRSRNHSLKPSSSSHSKPHTRSCTRHLKCFVLEHSVFKTKHLRPRTRLWMIRNTGLYCLNIYSTTELKMTDDAWKKYEKRALTKKPQVKVLQAFSWFQE